MTGYAQRDSEQQDRDAEQATADRATRARVRDLLYAWEQEHPDPATRPAHVVALREAYTRPDTA